MLLLFTPRLQGDTEDRQTSPSCKIPESLKPCGSRAQEVGELCLHSTSLQRSFNEDVGVCVCVTNKATEAGVREVSVLVWPRTSGNIPVVVTCVATM